MWVLIFSAPVKMAEELNDGFAFYKIAFQWYSTIGVVMTWIPGIIISHLTGGLDLNKFNIKLLSPFVQKMLPSKYRHIELKTMYQVNIVDSIKSELGTKREMDGLIAQNNENELK